MQDPSASNTQLLMQQRIDAVELRIERACLQARRQRSDVALIAVSKRHPIAAIQNAYALGLRQFAENYAQEGVLKVQQSRQAGLDASIWHFIGKLQSNKLKPIAQHFDWVQTVTQSKHIDLLNQYAETSGRQLQLCLQVKVGDECSKNGIGFDEVMPLLEHAQHCPHVKVRGLMAIPPAVEDDHMQQQQLLPLRDFFYKLQHTWPQLDTLSVGMSGDLEAAISAGSTMLRIGTALFGPRPQL